MQADVLLTVTGLSKTYGSVTALNNVHLTICAGEILGLIGPNGAGKTTLFECLAGIQPADAGAVVPRTRRSDMLFYMPDGISPWADQTVHWVLQYALGLYRGRRDLYIDIVNRLELTSLLRMSIAALSKGQRKRVLLALGLLTPQPVLLIDEPFDGLDLRQTREVARTLQSHA